MKLNEIKNNPGATQKRTRVGRGIGCSKGKTCGRGGKGQTARTGVRINGFEGGQMPLHRRLPKRGFNPLNPVEYAVVNVGDLQKFVDAKRLDPKDPVTEELLVKQGLVRMRGAGIKLLAKGEIKSKLTITVAKASNAAVEAVQKAGGTVKTAAA